MASKNNREHPHRPGEMISRQRLWQIRMQAAGRCIVCGAQATTAIHCETHQKKHNTYNREGVW